MSMNRRVALLGFNSFPEESKRLTAQLVAEGCTFVVSIDQADEVIVVSPDHSVTDAVQLRIDHAEALGIPIGWSHGEPMIEATDAAEERIANYLDE